MAGFRASNLQTVGEKWVPIDFGPELGVMELLMAPQKMTVAVMKELAQCDEVGNYGRATDLFFGVVSDWNLTDDNDEKLPLTQETIDGFGLEFVLMVMGELAKKAPPRTATKR